MNDFALILSSTVAIAAAGALPSGTAEVVMIGAALGVSDAGVPIAILACALSQMVTKSAIYGLARWAPSRLPTRARAMLDRAEHLRGRPRLMFGAVLTGSLVSVPPFYLVTVACGVFRIPFWLFATAGLSGTLVRYGTLVLVASRLTPA
jgi:membrane protein YqaA with SNARE-associated domain